MCFTIVVGRQATVDGSVLVGHNEENEGPYFVNFRRLRLEQIRTIAVSPRRATWPGELRLPRYGFLWSQIPGREYSDTYLNDAGLLILSNGCPSREDDLQTLILRRQISQEGIGGWLRRVVAEQAASAHEAVKLIGWLVQQFGYRDSGRTYVVADPQEAWLVAVVRGRRWLAQRVPDDAAVVVPNQFIFDQLPDIPRDAGLRASGLPMGPWASPAFSPPCPEVSPSCRELGHWGSGGSGGQVQFSPDLISYAVERGWYDPTQGRPFSFREAYQSPERNRPDLRQRWAQQLLEHPDGLEGAGWGPILQPGCPSPKPADPAAFLHAQGSPFPSEPVPWYVRPGRKLSVQDVAAILRNQQGPLSLFHPATQEMAIFQLRSQLPRPIGCVYWRTIGRPDWSPLLPWYLGVQQVPNSYCHPAFRDQLDIWNPAEPLPQQIFQPDLRLVWWQFQTLPQMGPKLPKPLSRSLRLCWAHLEQQLWAEQPPLEQQLLGLWKVDPSACYDRMTTYCLDQSERVCQQLEAFLQQRQLADQTGRTASGAQPPT